jgi:hypothetical protein
MKRHIHFLFFIFALTSFSCNALKPGEEPAETAFQVPVSSIISGQFREIVSGLPIEDQPIQVTLASDPPNIIINLDNQPIKSLLTSNSRLSFALDSDVEPNENNPIYIHLSAKTDGYIDWQQTLKIINPKPTSFYADLVPVGSPPPGILLEKASIQLDSHGRIQSQPLEMMLSSPTNDFRVKAMLPVGTRILDNQDTPLQGEINVTFVVYDARKSKALTQYQNTFATAIDLADKSKRFSGVIPFLWMDLDIIDQYGRKGIKFDTVNIAASKQTKTPVSFDKILQTMMTLNSPFPNHETRSTLQEGDHAMAWNYDQKTKEWTLGQTIAIGSGSTSSDLVINASLPAPGRWAFGWVIEPCPGGFQLNFSGIPEAYPLRILFTGTHGGFRYESQTLSGQLKMDIPINMDLDLKVFDIQDRIVANQPIPQACQAGQQTVAVNSSIGQFTTIRFIAIDGFCPCNAGVNLKIATLPVWYQAVKPQPQSPWVFAGITRNGVAEIRGLLLNTSYVFATWFDGIWYSARVSLADDRPLTTLETFSANIQTASTQWDSLSFVIRLSENACEKLCQN